MRQYWQEERVRDLLRSPQGPMHGGARPWEAERSLSAQLRSHLEFAAIAASLLDNAPAVQAWADAEVAKAEAGLDIAARGGIP